MVAESGRFSGTALNFLKTTRYWPDVDNFTVEEKQRVYDASEFRFLIPPEGTRVGQTWELEPGRVAGILQQFHPTMTEEIDRNGPGSFALLRARSNGRYEIMFRTHARFILAEHFSVVPGQFEGRAVLTDQGEVEWFEVHVPREHARNVNYEILNEPYVGMIFLDKLELGGGRKPDTVWHQEISLENSRKLLARRFFAFEELEWIPPEQVLERAKVEGKPILCIVLEGVLNDQSC